MRAVRARQDAALKAQFGRLFHAGLDLSNASDFPGKTHLAEEDGFRVNGLFSIARSHCCDDSQIDRGFVDVDATRHVDENVLVEEINSHLFFQHGGQKRDPVMVHADSGAPGDSEKGRANERLKLNQDGTRTFHATRDHGAGNSKRSFHQKDLGRIADLPEPGLFHLENADLVGRAEAVFYRSQNAETVTPLSFKVQDGVDHMLEDSWAGDRPVFGHVADQKGAKALFLRQNDNGAGALSDLADASRGRRQG